MACTINKLKSVEKQINHFCFSPAAFTSALLNLLSHPLKILYYWSFGKYKGSVRPFLTQFKIFDIMCSFYFFLGLRNLVCVSLGFWRESWKVLSFLLHPFFLLLASPVFLLLLCTDRVWKKRWGKWGCPLPSGPVLLFRCSLDVILFRYVSMWVWGSPLPRTFPLHMSALPLPTTHLHKAPSYYWDGTLSVRPWTSRQGSNKTADDRLPCAAFPWPRHAPAQSSGLSRPWLCVAASSLCCTISHQASPACSVDTEGQQAHLINTNLLPLMTVFCCV